MVAKEEVAQCIILKFHEILISLLCHCKNDTDKVVCYKEIVSRDFGTVCNISKRTYVLTYVDKFICEGLFFFFTTGTVRI